MIQWENNEGKLLVKSWCRDIEDGALQQAKNLSNHPAVTGHVALMPDTHQGYGMPIGGVIAAKGGLIPNAVGVDIGCGMGAIRTNITSAELGDMRRLRKIIEDAKMRIPVGEGKSRPYPLEWEGFERWQDQLGDAEKPAWVTSRGMELDAANLGTLGGGNHFIEIQKNDEGEVWLMLHSGSRNMGYRIAEYYHKEALNLNTLERIDLPDHELAYLPLGHPLCEGYIRDMNHALAYAAENRRIMMDHLKKVLAEYFPHIDYILEVNIHHNYAALEEFSGEAVWIHRKGATSAKKGQMGIIPGSMGTFSYIVEGLGNPDSFESCSHGAGRKLSRSAACKQLTREECDAAMEGIVYDRWKSSYIKGPDKKKLPDLSEAPMAYKDIDEVIEAELDLIKPLVKLSPLAVIKG